MRILLVTPHFPPRFFGGIETHVKRVADALLAAGEQPEVLCVEQVGPEFVDAPVARDNRYGYPVHRASLVPERPDEPLGLVWDNHRFQRQAEEMTDRFRPDVVHLHGGYLVGANVIESARARHIPSVVTLHDYWFVCSRVTLLRPDGHTCSGSKSPEECAWCWTTEHRRYRVPDTLTGGWLGRSVATWLSHGRVATMSGRAPLIASLTARRETVMHALARANLILTPSRFLRDLMAAAGVPLNLMEMSRCGIPVGTGRRRVRQPEEALRIGYLGQVIPIKGIHVLIDAVTHMPQAHVELRIHGDLERHPTYAVRLRRLARNNRRITFRGPYPAESIMDVLEECDVVVVPSLWVENNPLVIQEAQSIGVPVIASRLGTMRELVIDEQDGLLFEPGSRDDLIHALQRMLDEPTLLDRLHTNAPPVRSIAEDLQGLREHYRRLTQFAHQH